MKKYDNIWEIQKSRKREKRKSKFSPMCWEFRPENPFPEVPQSSCIFWHGRGQFPSRFIVFDIVDREEKNMKIFV